MEFFNTNMLNLNQKIDDLLKILSFVIALIVHDCVYQFIRIFYHSRTDIKIHAIYRIIDLNDINYTSGCIWILKISEKDSNHQHFK